jgi:DNA-binding transcriptional LysR family regulator
MEKKSIPLRFQFTLQQLRVFHTLSQEGNLTQAARILSLSQPAVSMQLRNFQEQFSIPLTVPRGRYLEITDFGREVASAALRILEETLGLSEAEKAFKGLIQGKLRLSVASTGKYVMPYFLQGFLEQHPGIELEMEVSHKQAVLESLFSRKVDFALVSVLPDMEGIDALPLLPNRLFLMGNALSSKKFSPLYPENLAETTLILREEGSATRQVVEAFFKGLGIPLKKTLQLTSNEAVKQAVVAGLGYSILPLIGARNEIRSGELQIIPVAGLPLQSEWNLISLRDRPLSIAAKGFKKYLEDDRYLIRQKHFSWAEPDAG